MNNCDRLLELIMKKNQSGMRILALDGRCAAGKTTLAGQLSKVYSCNVVHMDDFYLPLHRRTDEIMAQPGGNIDFERFLQEIIIPLRENRPAVYRPFVCHKNEYLPEVRLDNEELTVVEGSYSCHSRLREYYEACVFLDIDERVQEKRLRERNPEKLEMFQNIWIPREEYYFEQEQTRAYCDLILDGDEAEEN